MSLLPYLMGYEHPRSRYRPSRLLNQEFGLAIAPDDLLTAIIPSLSANYYRPWRHLAAAARDIGCRVKADKDAMQITVDVQNFAPEEVSVRTVDGYVVVEGQHEERRDAGGLVARRFTRRFALPEGAAEHLQAQLSSNGVLTVTVPLRTHLAPNERVVPVTRTGPVKKEIKDQTDVTDKKDGRSDVADKKDGRSDLADKKDGRSDLADGKDDQTDLTDKKKGEKE